MANGGEVQMNLNPNGRSQVKDGILNGITRVFQGDILETAVSLSPVDTGLNRRTIATDVERTPIGVVAELYTQSGYGGYLEIGTYKMEARPYLMPAFEMNISKVAQYAWEDIVKVTKF